MEMGQRIGAVKGWNVLEAHPDPRPQLPGSVNRNPESATAGKGRERRGEDGGTERYQGFRHLRRFPCGEMGLGSHRGSGSGFLEDGERMRKRGSGGGDGIFRMEGESAR